MSPRQVGHVSARGQPRGRGALKPVEPCFPSPGLLIRVGHRVPTLDDATGKRRGEGRVVVHSECSHL